MFHSSVFIGTILAAILICPSGFAQTTQIDSPRLHLADSSRGNGLPESTATPTEPVVSMESPKPRPAIRYSNKHFFLLSAGVYSAALADMHQTLEVRHISWWYETDPLARPFVHLPAPAYYATGIALATGVNWISWKMGRSHRWRKLAVVPQILSIGGNLYGFRSNRYSSPYN